MNEGPATRQISQETRRRITLWCLQSALGLVGDGVIIFLAAGTLRWVWGWALLAVSAAVLAGHPVVLLPINPELLAEREKGFRAEGTKRWDRWLATISGASGTIVAWVVAGLDVRFGWTAGMAPAVHLAGLVISVLGYAVFLWAMAANAFFAEGVRIQGERGHTVATGGPYRFVRHPGYVGAILSMGAAPFLLGSWWALIPAGLAVGGYLLRTALEDRTLQEELPGYREYTQQTRYRLLPGIW
jgi:protein-S-isoprenylcysteine O-methyltransferase Ste14